jgi:hypothetical protein
MFLAIPIARIAGDEIACATCSSTWSLKAVRAVNNKVKTLFALFSKT